MKALILFLIMSISFAETVKVNVPGMVCQMCVYGMKKNFKNAVNNPEKDIKVDLDKKIVTVNLSKKLSDEEILKRVKDAGYNAQTITRM